MPVVRNNRPFFKNKNKVQTMNMILPQVQAYLYQANAGTATMSDEIIDQAAEDFKTALRKHFTPKEPREFKPSMSSIGRPLCQQQMEKAGAERSSDGYELSFKFLIGDMIEVAAKSVMRGAGISIEGEAERVSMKLGGEEINGEYDIDVGGVWDIKSTSDYAFKYKYNTSGAFDKLASDDPFGYVPQGYLYGRASGKPFKGWIAISKNTGEWAVVETPSEGAQYEKDALRRASENLRDLKEDKPFKRCFSTKAEFFNKRPTGNKILPITCVYCAYKLPCWDDKGLTHADNPRSKAKTPSKAWYVGEVK